MKENKTILIVDDAKEICEILTEVFSHDGYTVFSALNVQEAIAIFKKEKPFLVITDIRLRNHVDGATMAGQMHMVDPFCIFVAMSGVMDIFQIGYMLGSIFTDFIQKPVELEIVQDIVKCAHVKRQRWESEFEMVAHK
jgi:two-component system, NtrC family, nitrogen regulation response regulator NtrX